MYQYSMRLVRVIDGDTVVADVDLGMSVWCNQHLRLYGINAPELNRGKAAEKKKGREAKDHLELLFSLSKNLVIHTIKDRTGKYGRYLAVIYGEIDGKPQDLNQRMIADGYAVAAAY